MSLSSTSLVDERSPPIAPSYAQDDSDDNSVSYARRGSMVAKLFAKNPPQVAVDERGVPPHQAHNEEEDHSELSRKADEKGGIANGNGHANVDEEDDDDEYVPGSSDEDSGSDGDENDDDDDEDLDDEETSMRSLLLPMATYAKQLLFLSENDDENGTFDDQDAALWASPEAKRAWIERYEIMNRAYIDQYGCRIDAPANPEIKKRLRRERNREAKYSLVLLALVVAYLIRLLVGPMATPTDAAIGDHHGVVSPSPAPAIAESVSSPASPETSEKWESTSPPWWTVWTEELVVQAMGWPQSVLSSWQLSSKTKASVESNTSDPPTDPSSDPEPSEPSSTTANHYVDDSTQTPSPSVESEEVVSEHEMKVVYSDAAEDGSVISTIPNANPTYKSQEEESTTQAQGLTPPVEVVLEPAPAGAADINVVESIETTSETVNAETETPATDAAVTESSVPIESPDAHNELAPASDEVHDDAARTHKEQEDAREKTTAALFKRCLDMFYMLVKMKHDASVKDAALNECDRAVDDAASNPASTAWIQSRVLRGDMRSLIQSFDEAQADYEAALSSKAVNTAAMRSEIQIKMASNRWIAYYHTKQFKELRNDCQRVSDHTTVATTTPISEPPDRVAELARDWLRAFRKETKVLEVLTKTRAWTLYRPAHTPQTTRTTN